MDDLLIRSSFEVRTSDAHPEERVAAEGDVLLLAIEDHAARCVTGCVEDLQGVAAKGDLVLILEICPDRRYVCRQFYPKEFTRLCFHFLHQELVLLMGFWLQTELFVYKPVADTVVEMSMCTEKVRGRQMLRLDIRRDCLVLFFV